MYHHHSQQQGPPPFSNGSRPSHHQPPPNQHQNRSPSNMLSQVMGFQFPRPTQLPDELESALAIRGARDMDHRLIDHVNQQNQGSGSAISQHGSYGSNQIALTSDNQPGHQQGVDWSSYQPPTKLFASPSPSANHQSQRHQGAQQQPQGSHAGTSVSSWTAPLSDSPSPQTRHTHSSGSGDGQALYTPESAGSILASFGLSNEDLEVLSHYPDDQLTPDTLPFILRDIQINKSGNQKTVGSTPSSSFSRSVHDMPLSTSRSSPLARSRSPEVPSLLTVTQTAGKVIDYGHASRAKEESSIRETFKREQLSSDRTVKLYPSTSSSSPAPKVDKSERRQVRLEHSDSSKHGDRDYRRTSSDHRKSSQSPGREFPPSSKSRNLDRDYRRDGPKPRPSSETKNEASLSRSLSSSSGSKPHGSSKKLPTPTMISDFSAVSPKVYPHTCSLCHTQCDQEKDWVDHVNTVNHTAACRDLRNKYPAWKPNLPSRSGRYGSRALWDPKDHSPATSVSRSLSGSPTSSPPHGKHRVFSHRPHMGPYSHHHLRHQHYTDHSHRSERCHSGSHSPSRPHRTTSCSGEHWPEKRDKEFPGGSARIGVKRPHDDSAKFPTGPGRHLSSSKAGHGSKQHGLLLSSTKNVKSGMRPGIRTTKTSAKPPPAKKKKKISTPASQDSSVAERLVYLTGIPKDASEQEVTDLVGSFGKINNVILMPCSEEESEKDEGQKASVCMVKAEDAQALASSTDLSIRDQQITASVAKKPEAGQSSDAGNSKPAPEQDKGAALEDSAGGEADQKTSDEKGMVLITGLPESGWSETDIMQLVQPFGTPSNIIQAKEIGKVLVSVPHSEIAEELVKVHAFVPAKIQGSELKMTHLKQRMGFSTPVALYNLLMGSVDPFESSVPVGWSSLLVISNVPNTPSASSEVQKLVRRFGTVIKTLVLNNMVICEMATAAMALSVYKRFQTFPCIIQNNPLFFSRKPDPKAIIQSKVITAYLESPEDTPANGKDSQAAADKETALKENSESPVEGMEKDADVMDEKMSTEKTVDEDKASGESRSRDDEIIKDKPTVALSDSLAAPEVELETDMRESSAVETVLETPEESKSAVDPVQETPEESKSAVDPVLETPEESKSAVDPVQETPEESKSTVDPVQETVEESKSTDKTVLETAEESKGQTGSASTAGDDKTSAGEETKPPSSDGRATSLETAMPELPKVTQELVDALLVECRTRTASHPNNTASSTNSEQGEAQMETEQSAKEPAKTHTEEEVKRQERERKEREARKEKEARERERKERERRAREKEERSKRERERDDRARRERERRERERRERKRPYGEGLSGSRSSSRSEGYKQREVETKTVDEEEFDDFPFNMSDFVTVDEVGDVADLPSSPPPSAPMETTEGGEDAFPSVQQDSAEDMPNEVTTKTTTSDASVTPVKSERASEPERVTLPTTETSDGSVSSNSTAVAAVSLSVADSSHSQTKGTTCEPEAPETEVTPETEATLTAVLDSTTETEVESLPAPAASAAASSSSPATAVMTSESEKEDGALNHSQATKEEKVLDKTEEQGKTQEEKDKETGAPAGEPGKNKRPEDLNTEEESVKKKLKTDAPTSTDCSLPPFDPSSPVGMEFLVPKTGFFCKVCNRFFSGTKEAEMNHCKTLKHYENLRKHLQTVNKAKVTVKPT